MDTRTSRRAGGGIETSKPGPIEEALMNQDGLVDELNLLLERLEVRIQRILSGKLAEPAGNIGAKDTDSSLEGTIKNHSRKIGSAVARVRDMLDRSQL